MIQIPSRTPTQMGKYLILIYNDYGSSEESVRQLRGCVERFESAAARVEFITGEEIRNGRLFSSTESGDDEIEIERRVLCIGGGFDLGYVEKIGHEGCQQIRDFVRRGFIFLLKFEKFSLFFLKNLKRPFCLSITGGNYLGICAGAYFACSVCDFDRAGPLRVVGERELKFFDGHAIGPCNSK